MAVALNYNKSHTSRLIRTLIISTAPKVVGAAKDKVFRRGGGLCVQNGLYYYLTTESRNGSVDVSPSKLLLKIITHKHYCQTRVLNCCETCIVAEEEKEQPQKT